MRKKIRILPLTAICLFAIVDMILITGVARSEYPERAVTILVSMAAGGPQDVTTRAVVIEASKSLGQPIAVENRGGGGGALALGLVAAAKPDGYTLANAQDTAIVDTCLMQKAPFKPLKSLTPITGFAASQFCALIVKNDAPWATFKEFIDYAKKNPGKIKYSSAGVGTGMHIAMEVIAKKEGIKWVHVPYKGNTPARTALMGGHVDACANGSDWPPYAQSKHIRVLAHLGEDRSPNQPNIPTIKELGYDYATMAIFGMLGPAGLPQEVVKKLETAFKKGTETAEFKTASDGLYLTHVYLNSKDFNEHLKEKWFRTEKLFKDIGIIKEAATEPY